MMRYNQRWSIQASFGLAINGIFMALLRAILALLPKAEPWYPTPPWLRVVLVLVALLGMLSIILAFILFAYIILQALARIETESLDTRGEMRDIKSVVRDILERERARYGLDPPDEPPTLLIPRS